MARVLAVARSPALRSLALAAAMGVAAYSSIAFSAPLAQLGGPTMGTTWSAQVAGLSDSAAESALLANLDAELLRIDQLMSTWNPSSELSLFNQGTETDPVSLHADTLSLVDIAREVTETTDGAYDITLGPLIDLWGFGYGGTSAADQEPDDASIQAALAATGLDALQRTPGQLAKTRADVALDLSSLAKGYAVDQLGELLEDAGHANYVVEIGGEIRTRGTRPDGTGWRIGIERPDGPPREGLVLKDAHVASSGSYRNVRILNNRVVSHLIDGRTGRPVSHTLVAVTVLHPESTALADAWATALMVVGTDAARSIAKEQGFSIQLISAAADGTFDTWRSESLSVLLVKGEQ